MIDLKRVLMWAGFGLAVGAISSVIATLVLSLFLLLLGTPLVFIGLALVPIVVVVGAITGAISWALIGLVYDYLLRWYLEDYPLFLQLFGLLIVVNLAVGLFTGAEILPVVVSSLFTAVLIWFISRVFSLPMPFEA